MGWVLFGLLTFITTGALAAPQASDQRTLFSEKDVPGAEKNFTGIRVSNKSQVLVYYHEQTISVVELGNGRSLLNCELLEVKTDRDRTAALASLKIKKKIRIAFKDLLDLMEKCANLAAPPEALATVGTTPQPAYFTQQLFMGIFPGMKWCGRGDIAANYFDLGAESITDKCCRTHDLCPVKVGGMVTQYNITNYSMVTRSHCDCDRHFLRCLKKSKNSVSDLIGNLYFNVGQLSCVAEEHTDGKNKQFLFKTSNLRY